MLHDILLTPFLEFAFMRRALVACAALCLGNSVLGPLLILRRMTLVGDAMAHAVLPGAAVGFMIAGLSLWSMSLGGVLAAVSVAVIASLISRGTTQREDASFGAVYLVALAIGVLLVSVSGGRIDLLHLLFGTVLAVDNEGLILVAGTSTVVLCTLALIYRPLIVDCLDRRYLASLGVSGMAVHVAFVVLVVLNLVAGFQVLGTLMSVGLLVLPSAAARFWTTRLDALFAVALLFGLCASFGGLLLSYHLDVPSGPAIVLVAGSLYLISVLGGSCDSILLTRLARLKMRNT
jgi:zinc/manganese transport system permease protein